MALIHVCLNVGDADRTARWYRDQLGFEDSWEFTRGDTRHVYVTDDSGTEIQLSDTDGVEEVDAGSAWDHLAVEVEDVEEAFDRIENHGVVEEPMDIPDADACVAFIEDPDGHVVELVEPQS